MGFVLGHGFVAGYARLRNAIAYFRSLGGYGVAIIPRAVDT